MSDPDPNARVNVFELQREIARLTAQLAARDSDTLVTFAQQLHASVPHAQCSRDWDCPVCRSIRAECSDYERAYRTAVEEDRDEVVDALTADLAAAQAALAQAKQERNEARESCERFVADFLQAVKERDAALANAHDPECVSLVPRGEWPCDCQPKETP